MLALKQHRKKIQIINIYPFSLVIILFVTVKMQNVEEQHVNELQDPKKYIID